MAVRRPRPAYILKEIEIIRRDKFFNRLAVVTQIASLYLEGLLHLSPAEGLLLSRPKILLALSELLAQSRNVAKGKGSVVLEQSQKNQLE